MHKVEKKRAAIKVKAVTAPYCVRAWTAKILLSHGKNDIFHHHSFHHDDAIRFIGLGRWVDMDYHTVKKAEFFAELKQRCLVLEKKSKQETSRYLDHNLKNIASLLRLNEVDCRVLEFSIYMHTEPFFNEALGIIGKTNGLKMSAEISRILDLPEKEVRKSLSSTGTLTKSGLLDISRRRNDDLNDKIELLSESFADRMVSGKINVFDLLKDMVVQSNKPNLTLADYDHAKRPIDLLLPYLQKSLQEKKSGVNILVYGSPGTGKTQLVKVLAKKLKVPLYEVAFEDEEGEPVVGRIRLKACSIAQHFFSKAPTLLIFDEVEDIFNDGGWSQPSTAQLRKAWLNRNLEENAVPTFWISNNIERLDPAFVRRFDMVFELPNPPRAQREKIVRQVGNQILDDDAIKRIAESEAVSPAVVSRATSVVRLIKESIPDQGLADSVEFLVSNTLAAQGHKKLAKRKVTQDATRTVYDISYINADTDVSGLADGLKKNSSARMCFYGPPGTGKTEFGRWLAKELDKKLIIKRGSDLLSMWVGGTEKNIAKAFEEASDGKSILLIDEVDSFLQDRRQAGRSWEITQVNEMLTQMEQFEGIFIASTNLVDNLDQASLRRFDLKVKFDYLKEEQAFRLIASYCKALEIPISGDSLHRRFNGMDRLASGDFAALMRQHRFKPFKDMETFIDALALECQTKEGGQQRRIGFV